MALRPIVYDRDRVIIGGNQRYKACRKLGMTEIPENWTVCADNLTDEQRRRFIIVDNSPDGMSGDWDMEILGNAFDIGELGSLGIDMPTLDEDKPEPQQTVKLQPLSMIHILVSAPASSAGDLLSKIEAIAKDTGAEVRHAAN